MIIPQLISGRRYAWAIWLPSHDGFAGLLFWSEPEAHARGCRTALWQTRREARAALVERFGRIRETHPTLYPGVRVVRVTVTVEVRV